GWVRDRQGKVRLVGGDVGCGKGPDGEELHAIRWRQLADEIHAAERPRTEQARCHANWHRGTRSEWGEWPMPRLQERSGARSSFATRSNRPTRRYLARERCRLFSLARARNRGTRPGGGTQSRVPASKRLEHETRHARVPLARVVLDVLVHDGHELAGRTRRL